MGVFPAPRCARDVGLTEPRGIQEGTSVSAKVREFLAGYAMGEQAQQDAAQAFIDAARVSQANASGTRWSREDAHQRPYPSGA